MIKSLLCAMLLALACIGQALADAPATLKPPKTGPIKVAFVISENANLMDIAGAWEVFQDTTLADGKDGMPFLLYTVAASTAPLHTTGSGRPGMTVTPDFSFAQAPAADIVVVGAQSGAPGLGQWLQRQHDEQKVMLSVCTGAFKFAEAGLLNGKPATTHHWYFGEFAEKFPDIKLVREVRYVQSDPRTYTAGGLSSGIDLALHIVAGYFGQAQAQRTADYMEYQGQGWKSNQGITQMTTPVKHELWSGTGTAGGELRLHMLTTGASQAFMLDLPARHVAGLKTSVKSAGQAVSFSFPVAGQIATFSGTGTSGSQQIKGTLTLDGMPTPLTLTYRGAE